MVGKRKRETVVASRTKSKKSEKREEPASDRSASTANESSAQDRLRKFFEAQFQPLEVKSSTTQDEPESESEEDGDHDGESGEESDSEAGSEWSGLDGEENTPVEVVEYSAPSRMGSDMMDKKARKAFMTAKPPSFSTELNPTTNSSKKAEDDEEDKDAESLNLKNDLALQRLLKESHLLESASDLAPTGKNRHKALDLRMQELGAKNSLYKQKNMPSAMRKGIKAKAVSKDDKRRREARENGIILEKPAPKKQATSSARRERGVGGSSVGKFTGGTLNLSKRDIAHVQGSRRGGKTRGRGGKSRGRR
ncbi:hypothetical protein BDV18DRAFT_108799 [Aspergillus unguis]